MNSTFLDDLLRPLNEGGNNYQIKILNYFRVVLDKAKNPEEADTVLDTYPDYWNQDEQGKEEKIRAVLPDGEQCALLKISPQSPLLSVERVAFTYNDVPMEMRRGLYLTNRHYYRNALN